MNTQIDHGSRAHATWSASATARNVSCPGALTLGQFAPPQKDSIHAARGTAAHEVSEHCLRKHKDAVEFLGVTIKAKGIDVEVDEEIVDSAQTYLDYVRERQAASTATLLMVEQKFSLAQLDPPFDAGGTGDAVIYDADTKTLEIIDLKHGMGVVDVRDNPQLRTYALGALLANPGFDVEQVKSTVVQPRAPHKDGRIRSETFHVADLIDWTGDLLKAMNRTAFAMQRRGEAGQNSVLLDEWNDEFLKPGACRFCPAEGFCPALRKAAIDRKQGVANLYYEDVSGEPKIANTPDSMSPDELAKTLDSLDLLEDWIKATRGYAHALAENGTEIPGYYLADKIGNRAWAADEAKVISDLKAVVKLTDDEIYAPAKIRSVAQLEKILGAKRKAEIANMWIKPVTGRNLVSAAKSSRPPAKTTADKYFEEA